MRPIYHITHIDNLARIIKLNGLWCDAERLRQELPSVGIAHKDLKDRRARTKVPTPAGGTLADYVPFYFANRSPMLYSICKGFVKGYQGGQEGVIYLVSSVERVVSAGRSWCFTDGHAVEAVTRFFWDLGALDELDWEVIESGSWGNTDNDPDRKRRKQAEFLVHRSLPWLYVETIGAINAEVARRVTACLSGASHIPAVGVTPKWYY